MNMPGSPVPEGGRLMLVGIGPGRESELTARAREALAGCEVVVGYAAYIGQIQSLVGGRELVSTGMGGEVERAREAVRLAPGARATDDRNRFACRDQPIHARGAYADALLPARHLEPMKLRTVKKLGKNHRNLLLKNARTIIFNGDSKAIILGTGSDDDLHIRQYSRFFARIQ